jgi:hypothetical protein
MMPKAQMRFLIGYCVGMLALTQFLQHSHQYRVLLEPLSALFGSMFPICISVFAIKNDWAIARTRIVDREESPVSFWLLIVLGFGLGMYLLYQGASGLASLV